MKDIQFIQEELTFFPISDFYTFCSISNSAVRWNHSKLHTCKNLAEWRDPRQKQSIFFITELLSELSPQCNSSSRVQFRPYKCGCIQLKRGEF
jgi:hypothetical protein